MFKSELLCFLCVIIKGSLPHHSCVQSSIHMHGGITSYSPYSYTIHGLKSFCRYSCLLQVYKKLFYFANSCMRMESILSLACMPMQSMWVSYGQLCSFSSDGEPHMWGQSLFGIPGILKIPSFHHHKLNSVLTNWSTRLDLTCVAPPCEQTKRQGGNCANTKNGNCDTPWRWCLSECKDMHHVYMYS